MMKKAPVIAAIIGGAAALVLSGAGYAAKGGNAAAGAAKSEMCAGCHGANGNSEDATFPNLAGQYEAYIVKQIKDFQDGTRANNEDMAGMAAAVESVEDAKDIAAFFASKKLSGKPLTKIDKDLAAKGEKLYVNGNPKSGVYGCTNCHGKAGKGLSKTVSAFPVVGGQHRDYLVKNLRDFRSGTRANDPGGMMSDIAKKMTDDEIKAVSEYLAAQ